MIRILSGSFKNFLAIGNVVQTIDLTIDGLVLVLGENADVSGANNRNGAGKTLMLQAICYTLFGKPLTKIRLDNLVNNINGKEMLCTLDFEVHGKPYRIERGRKPAVLRFFKDGVLQKQDEAQGENKHTQTEIERIIGMSHVMFRHIVALNTSTTPFLKEESGIQREVIEELFGITQLSQRADALKLLIDSSKEQVRDAEATIKANTEANSRIEQAIDRATGEADTWRSTQTRRCAELATTMDALHTIDIDYEIGVFDHIDQWREQKRETDGQRQATDHKVAAITQEIARCHQDIARHEADGATAIPGEIGRLERQAQLYVAEANQDVQPQIARLRSEIVRRNQDATDRYAEIEQLAAELADVDQRLQQPDAHRCDTCGQGLAGTDHLAQVVANLERQQQHLTVKIGRLISDREQAVEQATVAAQEIATLQTAQQHHRADLLAKVEAVRIEIIAARKALDDKKAVAAQQADQLRQTVADLRREGDRLLNEPSPDPGPMPTSSYKSREAVWQVRQERDALVSQLDAEAHKPNPHETKIEGLRSTLLAIDYTMVNDLTNRLKHETFLHKLLTAKDSFIRKRLIDQNLRYLNKRLDQYLRQIGLPHEVQFQADLSVEIWLLGAEFDFEQLSRGEMNRVILATSWAFRDVWENLNTTLNLLFVDEMLDQGTDGAGVEAALEVLSDMATQRHKSIFLISHRDELRDRIDHVRVVRKENQFTTFV